MKEIGIKASGASLASLGLEGVANAYWNLSPAELVAEAIKNGEGDLSDTGALSVDTGEFKGRSPKDRFLVADGITEDTVWWGDINIKFAPEHFDSLLAKVQSYLAGKNVYVRDSYACADPSYRLNIRVVTEYAFANMFANNLFLRPTQSEIENTIHPDWTIIAAPGFKADKAVDHTRQHNFAIINFTKKMVLIGGTGYTGEIKKSIFGVLNFLLPHNEKVLSMHCSANVGKEGDTAIFFGLSGTGKTTLSADPNRGLIGDDEHGWSDKGIFNFEGGCYAKCVNLSAEKEPEIFNAIKFGAILENIIYKEGTHAPDYDDISKTENTRVSYPIDHISNAVQPSVGGHPKNVFFLTADAFGVLPPISRLTPGQAMYQFISGYTAKVAGTEVGVVEPQATFSACFGKAFLPLHPTKYAELLGAKMRDHKVNVWLVNTGWTGGSYGVGSRMSLKYTRAMITAALEGKLDGVSFEAHPIFGFEMPTSCENVPAEILNPRNTWSDKEAYDAKANELAVKYNKNFEQFASQASEEILAAAPKVLVK
jgi:phosphoenolpyruvate carboxykinase (ATP)